MNKENEICLITMEECSEVIQAISKVQRFGIDGVHPVSNVTNRGHLEEEIGDLMAMIDMLKQVYGLDNANVLKASLNKLEKLKKWSNL
jgi:NTP pyrophosphatase (non-canonical NTP hydrolase)